MRISRPDVLLVACFAALATYLSYQPAVLVVIPLLFVLLATYLWRRFQTKTAHSVVLFSVLSGVIVGYLTYQPMYQRLVIRVGTSGEIWPTDADFTFYVFLELCDLLVLLPVLQ